MDHLRKQPARRLRLGQVIVGVLALGSAAALPGSTAAASAAPGGAAPAASAAVRTSASSVGVSSPAALGAASPARTDRQQLPVLRPARTGAAAGPATAVSSPGAVPSATAAGHGVGTPAQSFDGVSALDNKRAAGFDLEPPDEGLGASSDYVVNFVNVTGEVRSTSGAPLGHPFYLNDFFHEAAAANTSDPRIYFDAHTQRWVASILGYAFNSAGTRVTASHVDVAVSRTADPRGAWNVVRFDTSNPSHTGCPCLADYPILGLDRDNVYISTNEFTGDLQHFNGAQLYALSLAQLRAGAAHPAMVTFENLSVAGVQGFHVQPANTTGDPGVEYLMSSLDPNGTFDNRIAVWAVTDPGAVSRGGTPALSVRVIDSQAYAVPPNAQTPPGVCNGSLCKNTPTPTTGVVSANDDAMQEVQYVTTGCWWERSAPPSPSRVTPAPGPASPGSWCGRRSPAGR